MVALRNAAWPGSRPSTTPVSKTKKERTPREQLLAEIAQFMRAHPQFTQSRFGREAVDNPLLVSRLEGGLNPRPVTLQRVRAFIQGYRK